MDIFRWTIIENDVFEQEPSRTLFQNDKSMYIKKKLLKRE